LAEWGSLSYKEPVYFRFWQATSCTGAPSLGVNYSVGERPEPHLLVLIHLGMMGRREEGEEGEEGQGLRFKYGRRKV